MKKLTLFLTFVFMSMVFVMPSHSLIKKVAQTGLQFLKVDVGARGAAMGGAFMMVGDDANALFFNPAGIGKMQSNFDFFVTRTDWIADISYNAVGLVKNLETIGNIGFSFITCSYGDLIGTRVAATEAGFVETGNLEVGAYAVGFAFARAMTDKFTVGGQIKYASQRLGSNLLSNGQILSNTVSGPAYDFGTIFYPGFRSFRLGMNIRNFSEQFKYEQEAFQLPLTFVISFAMDVLDFLGEEHPNSLVIALDAIHPRDYTERIHLGAEYWFMKNMLAVRAGYKFNYDLEGISAGFGFKKNISGMNFKLDYSYSDLGVFNKVNRLSLGFSLE
jgi:hypothetical protein